MMINYATEFCNKVLSGEIVAGEKIKQAARRYQRDLKDSQNDDYPFYFSEKRADKAIKFCELMPAKDGSPLKLELFQKWIIAELFGWRMKDTGNRRYTQTYISMARKNGKSFLMADLGALYLLMESKPAMNREIVYSANSSAQARLAFMMLQSGLMQLSKVSPALRERLKINHDEVLDIPSNSRAFTVATNSQTAEGRENTLGVVDEYALAKTDEVLKSLRTGQVNSPNSLLAIISTTGGNLNSPMKQEYDYVSEVLNGKQNADRYFIAIWENDDEAEAFKPELFEKSNPLLANAEIAKNMLPRLINEIEQASQKNDMNTTYIKNLNMWRQSATESYISPQDWDNCIVEPPDIHGQDVYIGLDLSKSVDLTSVSWMIPQDYGLYCDSHSFVGTKGGLEKKQKEDGFNYTKAEKRDECNITTLDSGVINYDDVYNFIMNFINNNELHVKAICYDAARMGYLIPKFELLGMPLVEVQQGWKTLSIPTVRFRDDVYNGKIKHPDNKLLKYAVTNSVLTYTATNSAMVDKKRNSEKIDPVAAMLDAYSQAMDGTTNEANNEYYQSEDFGF